MMFGLQASVLIVGNCVLVKNNMSYNDFTLEQLNFIRTHWDYSELCKAIKEKNYESVQ